MAYMSKFKAIDPRLLIKMIRINNFLLVMLFCLKCIYFALDDVLYSGAQIHLWHLKGLILVFSVLFNLG